MAHMMTLALQQQEQLLRGYAQGLLAQVAQDYNLDHQELIKKYLVAPAEAQIKNGDGIPAPLLVAAQQEKTRKRTQKAKPDKVCCKGVTAKGQPCKFAALADGFCKKHSDINNKPEGSNTVKKTPKAQRPRHTHLTEEEPLETCQVCEQQGDVTNPQAPRQEWEIEGAEEIQARLKKMLAEAEELEETEEAEETDEPEPPEETTASLEDFGVTEEELGEHEEDDMAARLKQILAEDTDEEDDE
jgi:hypothetical protein